MDGQKTLESIPYSYQDRTYEIRVSRNDTHYIVQVFLNNEPASRFHYSAEIARVDGEKNAKGVDLIADFVERAKVNIQDYPVIRQIKFSLGEYQYSINIFSTADGYSFELNRDYEFEKAFLFSVDSDKQGLPVLRNLLAQLSQILEELAL
jgi:hypothetical protein